MSNFQIEYKKDAYGHTSIPYGISGPDGFILFFRKVTYYTGQEARYEEEIQEVQDLAENLLTFLNLA